MSLSLTKIKNLLIPAVFLDSRLISTYGQNISKLSEVNDVGSKLADAPVSKLAELISQIIAKLADADPKQIDDKPSWVSRFTGQHIENYVRYHHACLTLDQLIEEAQFSAELVRDLIDYLERELTDQETEISQLEIYIQAGREYLQENPSAGLPVSGTLDFENDRERFIRKIANLATLLHSNELHVAQMRLVRTQSMDMLDRFGQTTSVLLPMWRQHSLALHAGKNISTETINQARASHTALLNSLQKNLNP